MIKRFRSYIEKEFVSYPESEELAGLKEELTATLMDKYTEAMESGMNELDAYTSAIETMADLREQYKDQMDALHFKKEEIVKKGANLLVTSIWYFVGLTILFLVLQLVIFKDKGYDLWLIWPFGALLYVVGVMIFFNINAKLSKGKILSTLSTFAISIIAALIVFLALGFGKGWWNPAWLLMPFGVAAGCIVNAIFNAKSKKIKIFYYLVAGVLSMVIIHLGLLLIFKIDWGWLIYIVAVFAALIALSIKITNK